MRPYLRFKPFAPLEDEEVHPIWIKPNSDKTLLTRLEDGGKEDNEVFWDEITEDDNDEEESEDDHIEDDRDEYKPGKVTV